MPADAFNSVVGGAVTPEHAAAIGEIVPDKSRHIGLLREMANSEINSAQHARLFVGQALAVPTITEHQSSLFGDEVNTKSLIKERAQVLDKALSQLKSDKRIFGLLDREAHAIEQAGNRLSHATNVAKAEGAGRTAALLEKLATTHGPVSSYLDVAAKSVADGSAMPGQASRDFIRSVAGALEAGGINGLTTMAVKPPLPAVDEPSLFGKSSSNQVAPLAKIDVDTKAPKAPTLADLRAQAKTAGLKNTSRLNKAALIDALRPQTGSAGIGPTLGSVGTAALATGVVAAALTAANAAAIAGESTQSQTKRGALAAAREAVTGLLTGAAIGGVIAGGSQLARHVNPTLALKAAPFAIPVLAVAATGLTAYGLYQGGKQIAQGIADRRAINDANRPENRQVGGPVKVTGYTTRDGQHIAGYTRSKAIASG